MTTKKRQPWPAYDWNYLAAPGEIEGFAERCTALVKKMGGKKLARDHWAREQWRRATLDKLSDPSLRDGCLFELDVIDALEEACEQRWSMMYQSVDIDYIDLHVPRHKGLILVGWLPSPWFERFIAWDEVNQQNGELVWPDFVRAWKSDMANLAAYRAERIKAWIKITPADLPGAPLRLITPISVGRGWLPVVREALAQLAKLPGTIDILQIKEKYGALKIVTVPVDEETHYFLRVIGEKSQRFCEICGADGHLWHDGEPGKPAGWLRTRCHVHAHTRVQEVVGA